MDDPVGCVGVHWGAGVWAMIATGFFANTDKIQGGDEGIFRGGSGKMLGMNVAMVLATTVWSGGCTFILVSNAPVIKTRVNILAKFSNFSLLTK